MSVNAAPSSNGMSFGIRVTDCGIASATCAYPPRVRLVLSTRAITCSPALNPLSGGALATSPEISAPGTKGRGGLDWYWPATMSASKKLMPVALMLIRTRPSPGSPASTSSKRMESGPPSSCTTQAFTGRRLHHTDFEQNPGRTRTPAGQCVLYSHDDLDEQLAGRNSDAVCQVCGGMEVPRIGRGDPPGPPLPSLGQTRGAPGGACRPMSSRKRENHIQPA